MPHDLHSSMTLGEHLEELRKRLIVGLLGLIPLLILGLVFGDQILRLLLIPVETALLRAGQAPTLQALSPIETFASYIKVGFVSAFMLGVPWLVIQLWLFVRPGLYDHERRFARLLVPLSVVLTLAAAMFLYFVMLPLMLYFLISFGSSIGRHAPITAPLPEGVTLPIAPVLGVDPADPAAGAMWINGPLRQLRIHVGGDAGILSAPLVGSGLIAQQYRLREYVDLVFTMGIAFAIAFQTPIVVMLLSWAGIVDPKVLAKYRKHIILGCVVAAAILTPTGDPVTLALMTAPLYLLFESGLFLAKFVPAKRVAQGVFKKESWTDANEGDE
jgi:sec-independent protein translocase protein TatC